MVNLQIDGQPIQQLKLHCYNRIGRIPGQEFFIDDESIELSHAMILLSGTGAVYIFACEGKVFVNDREIIRDILRTDADEDLIELRFNNVKANLWLKQSLDKNLDNSGYDDGFNDASAELSDFVVPETQHVCAEDSEMGSQIRIDTQDYNLCDETSNDSILIGGHERMEEAVTLADAVTLQEAEQEQEMSALNWSIPTNNELNSTRVDKKLLPLSGSVTPDNLNFADVCNGGTTPNLFDIDPPPIEKHNANDATKTNGDSSLELFDVEQLKMAEDFIATQMFQKPDNLLPTSNVDPSQLCITPEDSPKDEQKSNKMCAENLPTEIFAVPVAPQQIDANVSTTEDLIATQPFVKVNSTSAPPQQIIESNVDAMGSEDLIATQAFVKPNRLGMAAPPPDTMGNNANTAGTEDLIETQAFVKPNLLGMAALPPDNENTVGSEDLIATQAFVKPNILGITAPPPDIIGNNANIVGTEDLIATQAFVKLSIPEKPSSTSNDANNEKEVEEDFIKTQLFVKSDKNRKTSKSGPSATKDDKPTKKKNEKKITKREKADELRPLIKDESNKEETSGNVNTNDEKSKDKTTNKSTPIKLKRGRQSKKIMEEVDDDAEAKLKTSEETKLMVDCEGPISSRRSRRGQKNNSEDVKTEILEPSKPRRNRTQSKEKDDGLKENEKISESSTTTTKPSNESNKQITESTTSTNNKSSTYGLKKLVVAVKRLKSIDEMSLKSANSIETPLSSDVNSELANNSSQSKDLEQPPKEKLLKPNPRAGRRAISNKDTKSSQESTTSTVSVTSNTSLASNSSTASNTSRGRKRNASHTTQSPTPKKNLRLRSSTNISEYVSSLGNSKAKIKVALSRCNVDTFGIFPHITDLVELTTDPMECDILVMDKGERTYKFLIAVASNKPILSSKWLQSVKKNQRIDISKHHIFKDNQFEEAAKFNPLKVLENPRILSGYDFLLKSNIIPDTTQMKNIITCAGGTVLTKPSQATNRKQLFVVAAKNDDQSIHLSLHSNVVVTGTEGVMRTIVQQDVKILRAHKL